MLTPNRHLVRELSRSLENVRGMNRTPLAPISPSKLNESHYPPELSTASSGSLPTNPDDILCSTRVMDEETNYLPALRTAAKRFGPQTSSLRRRGAAAAMCPQNDDELDHSNLTDEDGNVSVEVARGIKPGKTFTPSKLNQSHLLSPNLAWSLGDDTNHDLTVSPPPVTGARSGSLRKREVSEGARKQERQTRRASAIRTRTTDKENKPAFRKGRTTSYAEAEARILAAHPDTSYISDQPTPKPNVRGTRFTAIRAKASDAAIPTRFSTRRGLMTNRADTEYDARNNSQDGRTATLTHGYGDSFALPEEALHTDLISIDFRDTPQRVHSTRPSFLRTAIANSNNHSGRPNKSKPAADYPHVEGIPLPDDEKMLFSALKALQERIAQLEETKTELNHKLTEKDVELTDIQTRMHAMKRSGRDSALGSEDEPSGSPKGWKAEKLRLESQIHALQVRVDRSEREASLARITTKRVTDDRDNMAAQLDLAYRECEALRDENVHLAEELTTTKEIHNRVPDSRSNNHDQSTEALRRENLELRQQLKYGKASRDQEVQRLQEKEREMGARIRCRDETIRSLQADPTASQGVNDMLLQENDNLRAELRKLQARHAESREKRKVREEELKRQLEAARRASEEETQKWSQKERLVMSEMKRREEFSKEYRGIRLDKSVPKPSRDSGPKKATVVEVDYQSDISEADSTTNIALLRTNAGSTPFARKRAMIVEEVDSTNQEDFTELSSIDTQIVADIRRTIEQERIARRNGNAKSATRGPFEPAEPKTNAGLKSALKASSTLGAEATAGEKHDLTTKGENRRYCHSTGNTEGITSAFILPDITLDSRTRSILNRPSQETSEICSPHDTSSCPICGRLMNSLGFGNHAQAAEKVEVPEEGDSTLRPAEAPASALSGVIHELEDEIKHLKLLLREAEMDFLSCDPSRKRRFRKAAKAKQDIITSEIDRRSDWVYRLYDAQAGLEGNDDQEELDHTQEIINEVRERDTKPAAKHVTIDEGFDSEPSDNDQDDFSQDSFR